MQTKFNYECKFCGARFKTERRFLAHKCKEMHREEEIQTTLGQAAWSYYQRWMRQQRKMVHGPQSFLHSKFYRTFIRFAQFVNQARLPDNELFIWLMVEENIPPTLWTNDTVYGRYTEFLDHKMSPIKLAGISINTILDYTEQRDVPPGNFFSLISANEVIQLIRQRKLSPWMLLNSAKFRDFYANTMSGDHEIFIIWK